MADRLRVLLADDEPLVRHGLRGILEAEPDIEVVGEAADGAAAVSQTRSLRPDLVCMDIQMPGVDGLRATSLVLGLPTPPKVLVLTTFGSDENVFAALAAGASAFLLKRASGDEIAAAVRAVAAGDSLLFPESVRSLAAAHVRMPSSYAGPSLTAREGEVLHLIAQGLSNAEIAERLVVGIETVRTHVARLLAKLGARDRTQAVVIAYQTGLVPLAP